MLLTLSSLTKRRFQCGRNALWFGHRVWNPRHGDQDYYGSSSSKTSLNDGDTSLSNAKCHPSLQNAATDRSHYTEFEDDVSGSDGSDDEPHRLTWWDKLEWSTKSLVVLVCTAGFFYAWHKYNEYYRQRGLVHPITAWIARRMSSEEMDRQKRVECIELMVRDANVVKASNQDYIDSLPVWPKKREDHSS